jgi:hypothetical protein
MMRTYRDTGAYWFFRTLWEYYCPHLKRPLSDGKYFFIGLEVVPQDKAEESSSDASSPATGNQIPDPI